MQSVLSDGSGASLETRIARTAQEADVSARTLERWIWAYRQRGPAGLVDATVVRQRSSRVDPRWDAACLDVLRRYTAASTPTRGVIIAEIDAELRAVQGDGTLRPPHRATAYRRLRDLSKGRYTFGSAKARRSVANRPQGPYGRLRATRPGEYVVLDTTPLDVFAMEPVTLRWVPVELTVAQDLYTRCILGLRLTPVSTKSQDVANVLYSASPRTPPTLLTRCGRSTASPATSWSGGEDPSGTPGRPEGVPAACRRRSSSTTGSAHDWASGCSQRFRTSRRTSRRWNGSSAPCARACCKLLPAYKGPDVFARGKDVESEAFYYVGELEQAIREWVGRMYHQTKHTGLYVPEIPGAAFSPAEMFEIGVARTGWLLLPSRPDLAYEFLDVAWRTIQHYGVEVGGQRYDGPALNLYRNVRSLGWGRRRSPPATPATSTVGSTAARATPPPPDISGCRWRSSQSRPG